jgi:hypothetical protein
LESDVGRLDDDRIHVEQYERVARSFGQRLPQDLTPRPPYVMVEVAGDNRVAARVSDRGR